MATLFRDSSAGQICRLFLGMKITPYEDEKDGFQLSRSISKPEKPLADRDVDHDVEKSEESDKDLEKEAPADSGHASKLPATDASVVEFTGSDDEDNPQNWSGAKKSFVFSLICLLTFSIYSASAIITPAEPVFEQIFGVSAEVSSLVLSMYVLGYGIGPLIFSPMSEMPAVGRNLAYLSSFFIFIVITAIASRVSNYPGLVVLRFIQGFFGGPVLATGAASAQDLFPFNKVPYALSCWAVFAYAGPALGPVLTGFSVPLSTWRWTFYETLILCGFTFVLLFFFLPETNAEYILGKRAQRLRLKTGDSSIKTRSEIHAGNKDWLKLTAYHLTMPFKITILDPSVLFINLYTALVYGIYYSFFESFPLVYIGIYGFSIGIMGTVFLSVIIGAAIGLAIYTALVWFIYEPYTLKNGVGHPESRLVPGIYAAAFAPAGMFIFGYASRSDITWVAPTVGIAMYAASSFILVNVIFVYLPISYPRYAASVFAANGFLRSAMACGAIHFSQPLFGNLGVGDGCAILGSLAAACAFGFLALYSYGPKLRARSKFAESY
ncbi:cycloheximide resistance protein [Microthyrium microscopicum]|uniref:Cycloheximide resistance protein n=1 Tax=Microthyrium microscopicum TaxID=703497 RepID=A0A6A6UIG9_9PEZI|nr:cycloheximide resistance protein [Microthyrium microscopicum]